MPASLPVWLLVAGFLGAGLFNAIGTAAVRRDYLRWGYPSWWGRVTGGLEAIGAVLIAWPAGRTVGLVLGALIVVAAIATVLHHREFRHLPPLGLFALLLVLAALWS